VRRGTRTRGIGLLAACALLGFSAAFSIAATTGEDAPAQTTTQPPTTQPPTTEPPPTEPPPPPRQLGIPDGVTVGRIDVGGLLPYEASVRLREAFSRPVILRGPGRKLSLAPEDVGARANFSKAVGRARFSRPGANVPLYVWVSRERIRGYVESVGSELDRASVSAEIVLTGATIRAKPAKPGRRLNRVAAARAIRVLLKSNVRKPIPLTFGVVKPKISENALGPSIVIMRSSNRLRL
jgi:Putative peptidoglycan binding domain